MIKRLIPLILIIICILCGSAYAVDNTHYFVTAGNWSNVDAWSAANDGVADVGYGPPAATDSTYFNASSGNCTLDGAQTCLTFIMTGYAGTVSGTGTLSIAGSWTQAGVWSATGTVTLTATGTLTQGAATISCPVTINAPGGTVTLGSALNIGTGATQLVTFTAGTLNTANYDITAGWFYSPGTGTRVLTLGSSIITLSYTFGYYGSNMTVTTPNTSTINAYLNDGSGFNISSLTGFNNINLTTVATLVRSITMGGCANLTIIGSASNDSGVTFTTNPIVTNALTITGNSSINRLWVQSSVLGTPRTLTVNGTVNISNCDLMDITRAGNGWLNANCTSSSVGGGLLSGCADLVGATNTFTAPATIVWGGATGNWNDPTKWTGGVVPLIQDTADFNGAMGTVTMNMRLSSGIDASGASSGVVSLNQSIYCYNNIDISGVTLFNGSSNVMYLSGRTGMTLKNNTNFNINTVDIYAPNATITLLNSLVLQGGGNANRLRFSYGVFDANDFNVTCNKVAANATIVEIKMGNGVWICSDTSTSWYTGASVNLTVTPENSTIKLTGSAAAITFDGGNKTYNNLTFAPASDSALTGYSITGANTFNTITNDTTAGRVNVSLAANQTVGDWVTTGLVYSVNIYSSAGASPRTITDAAGITAINLNGGYTWSVVYPSSARWVIVNSDEWKCFHPTAPFLAPSGANFWHSGVK